MIYQRKLKPGSKAVYFIPAFVVMVIFVMSNALLGLSVGFRVLGWIFAGYGLLTFGFYYLKTRNFVFLISSLYLLAFAVAMLTIRIEFGGNPEQVFPPVTRFFGVWAIAFWVWLAYFMMSGKTGWQGNQLLELSALDVGASDDSYTERPFPVAKLDMAKEEVLSFAVFMRKNKICMTYGDADKIYFVPVNDADSYMLPFDPDFNVVEKTWVAFDFNGEVSGHISRQTYLSYRENLDFDQLCLGLGNLFVDFFEWYRKGEGVRINDRLKEMKTGIFS